MGAKSFTEYVSNTFENEFYNVCNEWLEEHKDSLEISEHSLHQIGELEVDYVNVKWVWVEDQPDMRIKFDVSVEAEYSVSDGDYHYDDSVNKTCKLIICCQGDLSKDLDDFEVINVSDYDGKSRKQYPLSDALVPIIYKNQLDEEAEKILKKYYPKALLQPMEIDPYELAQNMGLNVEMRFLTKDASIFGRTFFYDCDAELYDPTKDEMYVENVKAGTIIVDKQAYFMYVIGASHNTIVHECVHWEKHKKAIALARLYDKKLSSIGCQVVGGIAGYKWDSYDFMEWQANAIAPKIQMPKEMFSKYVDSLITKYRRETKEYDLIDIIEQIISEISIHLGVSKTAAKIRLLEIGKIEAQGAWIFVDGKHIPPHKSSIPLEVNQTYSIGIQDAAILSFTNAKLQKQLNKGIYIYLESHFVLNHPRYVETNILGEMQLTHYARNHMEECCLLFDMFIESQVGAHYHTECFLNRESVGSNICFRVDFSGDDDSSPDKQGKAQAELIKLSLKLQSRLTTDYTESMNNIMDELNISAAELARRTGLNERTIRRNISGESFNLDTLVLMLLGMQIPYDISSQLISMSQGSLVRGKHIHQCYMIALQYLYPRGIGEIQKFFDEQGVPRL